jgi:hypothetical protein
MHDRKVLVRYFGEMTAAFLFYALVLIISIDVGRAMPNGIGRTLLLISPMIPVFVVIGVIARHFARVDEYQRRWMLESIAIAAGVTAGGTFTYGFFENAGFPHVSMFNVLPTMGFAWIAVVTVRMILRR